MPVAHYRRSDDLRRPCPRTTPMIRRSIGGAILGFALFVGSFAWSGFVALQTVFDPDRSREVAEELLDNDEVRAQLAENLAGAIGSLVPREVPVEDGLVEQVTVQLLNDPTVEETILAAFTDTHAAFLGEGDVPGQIDLSPVAAVARQNLVAAAPQLDTVVPASPPLTVPLPTDRVPNASPVRSFLEAAVPVLAAVAAFAAILALVATNDRPSILRRAGTWALTTTAIYLILGLGVPYALRQYAPDQAEVIAALLSALLRSLLVPSIALGIAGLALLGISAAWSASRARGGKENRRPPDPDAAHRRQVSGMEGRRRSRQVSATPSPQPDPYGRPAERPPATSSPGPAARARQAAPQRAPQAAPPPTQPASPVPPADPLAEVPAASPYPDEIHYRETHPEDQWPHLDEAAAAADPGQAARAPQEPPGSSVFADVPLPADPVAPSFTPPPQAAAPVAPVEPPPSVPTPPQAASEPGRSVFDAPPAEPAPAPRAPSRPSAPPVGARWNATHGWILDPDSPDPLPEGAIWVDGVGYVLPEPGHH